jgi:3-dehydro-L-gulonate 2-dehydrogenase
MAGPGADGRTGETVRLQRAEIEPVLASVLHRYGFSADRAEMCARLFTEASLDGVYSHGLNRFPGFVRSVQKGFVRPEMAPTLVRSAGSFECWDGNLGPGNLNARASMARAIGLARRHGTGIVALRNTNHWMRGGAYGLQAAREDCIGICTTNTLPNMPPWGGGEPAVGNNPLVIAVPRTPYPFLLDMAMSQFSYGKLEVLQQRGDKLPFAGGFDRDGQPTDEPGAILETELTLPMGYWKGSGLAIMIDLVASLLSGGLTTREIGRRAAEHGVSQLFAAFDLRQLSEPGERDRIVQQVTASLQECAPLEPGGRAHHPGDRSWLRRQENETRGIPVDRDTWAAILAECGGE